MPRRAAEIAADVHANVDIPTDSMSDRVERVFADRTPDLPSVLYDEPMAALGGKTPRQ